MKKAIGIIILALIVGAAVYVAMNYENIMQKFVAAKTAGAVTEKVSHLTDKVTEKITEKILDDI